MATVFQVRPVGPYDAERERAFAHVTAAGWGKGVGTLLRITRMALRHPWQVAIALVAIDKIPGGLGGVWDTAVADGRLELSLSFNLHERVNLGSLLIAAAFLHLVQMGTDQVSVQRYLTAGSLREAKRSLWIKLWFIIPVLVLFYGTGLVLYAFYKIHGDPLAAGFIEKEDQILPYFVITQLPTGLPGLLIAAIYAASMSTISAALIPLSGIPPALGGPIAPLPSLSSFV